MHGAGTDRKRPVSGGEMESSLIRCEATTELVAPEELSLQRSRPLVLMWETYMPPRTNPFDGSARKLSWFFATWISSVGIHFPAVDERLAHLTAS